MVDLAAAITRGRALHDLVLTDTITIERHSGTTPGPHASRVDVWEPVYTGPGLVQAAASQPRTTDAAGVPVTVTQYIGKAPIAVQLAPRTRYRVRVTESADPGNVGTYTGGLAESAESNAWAIGRRLHLTRS